MSKCIISLHGGRFIYGSIEDDIKQNILISKLMNIRIINLDFPKNNYEDTMIFLEKELLKYSKKYNEIYLIGRSSGGYLAKQLFDKYNYIIKKVIYIAPVFNVKLRSKLKDKKKYKIPQKYFFRNTKKIYGTKKWCNKEYLILAKKDKNIPIECFTTKQIKNAIFFNKTHKGLVHSKSMILINIIKNIFND
jgi:esterase/lipase